MARKRWFIRISRKRKQGIENANAVEAPGRWPLSMKLVSWNEHDHVHLFDAVTSIGVFGATGSAKSSTTVKALSESFLLNGFGAIFFAIKPDDPQNYLRQAVACGREKDVVLFGPAHGTTLNFIEDGLGHGGAGLAANITTLLSIVSRLSSGGSSGASGSGREDGSFWEKMDNRLIAGCTDLLIRSGEPVTTLNLERIVLSIPRGREQVGEEHWQQTSYLAHCLRAAEQAEATPADQEELERLANYFLLDLAQIGDRLRATVQTSVGATLDLFNHPLTRRLLSSPSPNFRLESLQEGKVLIVDMSTMTWGTLAVAIQKVLKFCFQLAQNRRDVATNPRPVAMICDEAQVLLDLEHDAAFGCTARSTRTVCLYATQSISNLLAQSGGPQGEARVSSFLGNVQCQVFHQTTDVKTVEYAQALFGKRKRLLMQGGMQQPNADWAGSALGLSDSGSVNAGYSENLDYDLQAEAFQRLEKGGPPAWQATAIVYQAGKHFVSSGRPYLFVLLSQQPNAL